METVEVGGVRLRYQDTGRGPAVVLQPGFSNNHELFDELVDRLAVDHRCITFDPRGTGSSDKPDSAYTFDELAGDIVGLIAALDLHDVTLVGHSMGGATAVYTVLDHDPERRIGRLVLIAPALPTGIATDELGFGMPPEALAGLQAGLADDWQATQLAAAQSFYHQTAPERARHLAEQTFAMPPGLGLRQLAQLETLDLRDRLDEVRISALVLWGVHDQIMDPRAADWIERQNLPGWQVERLQHSGHGATVDEPERIAELIREYVRDAVATPRAQRA
jgi:pimeloyl-ACP methyl ester carboxylesterase